MAVHVGVVGLLKTRGSLGFPQDVFIVPAAVGRVNYRRAGTVRTGPPPPKPRSALGRFVCWSEGKRSAGRSGHSQHDFTKDNSMRKALVLVPQSGPAGRESRRRSLPPEPSDTMEKDAWTKREKKAGFGLFL